MNTVVNFILASKKAVAGFVVAAVLAGLRFADIEILPDSAEGLRVFIEALIVGVVIWFSPKNEV